MAPQLRACTALAEDSTRAWSLTTAVTPAPGGSGASVFQGHLHSCISLTETLFKRSDKQWNMRNQYTTVIIQPVPVRQRQESGDCVAWASESVWGQLGIFKDLSPENNLKELIIVLFFFSCIFSTRCMGWARRILYIWG